jgi:hypothetical protein
MCPTHDRDFKVGSRRVTLVVPRHTGVGGGVLLALNIRYDQGAVGKNNLTIVEGQLATICEISESKSVHNLVSLL